MAVDAAGVAVRAVRATVFAAPSDQLQRRMGELEPAPLHRLMAVAEALSRDLTAYTAGRAEHGDFHRSS
jgi:hypothetical protein